MLLGQVDKLKKETVQCINLLDRSFVLIYQNKNFYLLDNLCPHKAAALCEGELQGNEILCPWHKAKFDIQTGKGITALAGNGVKSWPLSIKDNQLDVDLTEL